MFGVCDIWSVRADVPSKALLPQSLIRWSAAHLTGPVMTEDGVHVEVGQIKG